MATGRVARGTRGERDERRRREPEGRASSAKGGGSSFRRGAVFFLSLAVVAAAAVAVVGALRRPPAASWPDRVAVIGLDRSAGRDRAHFFAIVDPARRVVVEVPADAVVEVPGSGFLRAYHAWRLGGAPLVRRTLGLLFGVDVPFSVAGPGDGLGVVKDTFTEAEVVPTHVGDLRTALDQALAGWERITVEGREVAGAGGEIVELDHASVRAAARALGGYGTRVFASATEAPPPAPSGGAAAPPRASVEPSTVTVDVLNGGSVDQAAAKTAERLRSGGYRIGRISSVPSSTRSSVVYYADARARPAAEQVAAFLGYAVGEKPSTVSSSAPVVVLLSDDARI